MRSSQRISQPFNVSAPKLERVYVRACMLRDSQLSQSYYRVSISQLEREDCVTEVVPVNDCLSRLRTTNEPHDPKSWDARWILLGGQLTLIRMKTN